MAVELAEPATVLKAGDFDRAVLEELGEPYEKRTVPLGEIDPDTSRKVLGQVRIGPEAYDEAHAEMLRTVLEQEGELPPGIAYVNEDGRLIVLSGNHRLPAHKEAGRPTMEFYVATGLQGLPISEPRVQEVAYKANAAHGKPLELDQRLEQAARLVEASTQTIRDAAKLLSVPEGKLRDHIEKLRARRRLLELGIETDQIPVTAQRRLASLPSDQVMKAASRLVPLMPKKSEEVNALVVALHEARSEKEQLDIIKQTEEALNAAGAIQAQARKRKGGTLVNPKIRRLDGALGIVLRFDQAELSGNGLPAEYREHFEKRVRDAINTLYAIQKVL
jgi:hypothetical protein